MKIVLPVEDIRKVGLNLDTQLPFHIRFNVRPKTHKMLSAMIPEGQGAFEMMSKSLEERDFRVILPNDLSDEDVQFLNEFFGPLDKIAGDTTINQTDVDLLNAAFAPSAPEMANENGENGENYKPPTKKSRKNSQLQENIDINEPRTLRARRNKVSTLKEPNTDDESEYQKHLNIALTESLKNDTGSGDAAEKTTVKPAAVVDRFPEFNNELKLLTYNDVIITMEDYKCLDYRELLLDVVLDFYLSYIHQVLLPTELRDRVFVFNSQMYNNLAISTNFNGWKSDGNKDIPAAKKRHDRVKAYFEGVNLFEKDFLVVPCYDSGHWFLAIVCHPTLNGCEDSEGNKHPIEAAWRDKQSKFEITGPIKASVIMVFDSVSTNPPRRNAAIQHLRNFLCTEFDEKYKDQTVFVVDKVNIRGASAKVRKIIHQNNKMIH